MNKSDENNIAKLISKAFNYKICNVRYFSSALTHKSTSKDNYERLEILGDAILQLIITELLFKTYPDHKEGQITVIRQNLVNSKNLEQIFLSLKLEKIFKKSSMPYGSADLNVSNAQGERLIHQASFKGHLHIVKWLIQKRTDVRAAENKNKLEAILDFHNL